MVLVTVLPLLQLLVLSAFVHNAQASYVDESSATSSQNERLYLIYFVHAFAGLIGLIFGAVITYGVCLCCCKCREKDASDVESGGQQPAIEGKGAAAAGAKKKRTPPKDAKGAKAVAAARAEVEARANQRPTESCMAKLFDDDAARGTPEQPQDEKTKNADPHDPVYGSTYGIPSIGNATVAGAAAWCATAAEASPKGR